MTRARSGRAPCRIDPFQPGAEVVFLAPATRCGQNVVRKPIPKSTRPTSTILQAQVLAEGASRNSASANTAEETRRVRPGARYTHKRRQQTTNHGPKRLRARRKRKRDEYESTEELKERQGAKFPSPRNRIPGQTPPNSSDEEPRQRHKQKILKECLPSGLPSEKLNSA